VSLRQPACAATSEGVHEMIATPYLDSIEAN
jgi:hypothetical protein